MVKKGTYDYVGNILTETNGNGNTTTFQYNALNKLRKAIYPGDETIPEYSVTYQYDVMGRVISKTYSNNRVDEFTYDNQGKVLSSTKKGADSKDPIITSQKYDINNYDGSLMS